MRATSVAALLSALLLPACAGSETQPLAATSAILDKLPRVDNSTKAPCWQQRQIAAQNSYVDTIRKSAERVYKAPCDVDVKRVASK